MKTINATLWNFLFVLVFLVSTSFAVVQNCEVNITTPAVGSQVGGKALISGTATIPPSGHLWILSHQVGINGYWPQGNGPAQIKRDRWNVLVYFGEPGDLGMFEVVAIVVDDQSHQTLIAWVQSAPNTSPPYQPISLPMILESCTMQTLLVDKTHN